LADLSDDGQLGAKNCELRTDNRQPDKLMRSRTVTITVDLSQLENGMAEAVSVVDTGTAQMQAAWVAVAREASQAHDQMFRHFDSAFRSALRGVMQGTHTVSQAFRRMGVELEVDFASSLEKMLTRFAAHQLRMLAIHQEAKQAEVTTHELAEAQKRGISLSSTLKDVTNSAVSAAGRAYSAMADIPVIGPALGAVAAAAAFAGVMALGALASAAGGMVVPQDMPAFVHKNEMVLPAYLSQPLQAALTGGGGGGGGIGGHTFNYSHTTNVNGSGDPQRVAAMAASMAIGGMKRMLRDAGLKV
jgi:hypothetical protein